jgi:spore maturation protein CgeB
MKLLIVGYNKPGQMGNYLASAARHLGLDHYIMDAGKSETANPILQKAYWHFRGKRPVNLSRFATQVLETCAVLKPGIVLTTGGRAPLERPHIEKLRESGTKVINYSTDDPWNPVLYAPWFLSALPAYDSVFSPRRANFDDFRRCGVRNIHYLPFAYDPDVHRPWTQQPRLAAPSDILFVGGCDKERLPFIGALIDAGLTPALFGGYWNRHYKTRAFWRGVAGQDSIRAATATAGVSLCLVRRANRDGHVMRSFEAAAIGGCILAEDTEDHREIFGPNDRAVRYFNTIPELVNEARRLISDADTRQRLSVGLRERMASRHDTYADRLKAMVRQSQADGL